jgi:thiol-disulfide isomerase/thioredoxin
MVDLGNIRKRTKSASEYIETLPENERQGFLDVYEDYELDFGSVEALRKLVKGVTVVVLSAGWCKDCKNAIPVLAHLEGEINLDVRVFGGIKTAPLDPNHKWAVPPSPPEAEDWKATAIPWIEIFDKEGNKIGTIIEKPAVKTTLEAELLYVLENRTQPSPKRQPKKK